MISQIEGANNRLAVSSAVGPFFPKNCMQMKEF